MGWETLRPFWRELQRYQEMPPFSGNISEADIEPSIAGHRRALEQLVAAGQIETAVAEQLQKVYAEALYHQWRSHAHLTCYRMTLLGGLQAASRGKLVKQIALLRQAARGGQIGAGTLTQAETAIARELATLALTKEPAKGEPRPSVAVGMEAAARIVREILQGE
jgi:hypothetical protein